MKTNRILTEADAKAFFNTTINSFDDCYGIGKIDVKKKTISFDFTSVLLLSFDHINASEEYPIDSIYFDDNFRETLEKCLQEDITEKSEFLFSRNTKNGELHFTMKVEPLETGFINIHIINYEKLQETEKELRIFSAILDPNSKMFSGSTWWIDYDRNHDYFYQSNEGPTILGIPVNENMTYSILEFQSVRENARTKSQFYDECIKMEEDSFNRIWNSESDYFAGRTPAYTKEGNIVWVEAYGKCFLRYKDGTPRFFVAIDIYLSDVVESLHQLNILNNLVNIGLINSEVGIWYYQKNFLKGNYYFTKSHRELMGVEDDYNSENITQTLDSHNRKIIKHTPSFAKPLNHFRQTHAKIFTGEIDKYKVVIPNNLDKDIPKWIEIRGTVIERDEKGEVVLFVGVSIDVTQTRLRNIELERLKAENEHLQLAEKLAIKAGNVIVWYQDEDHIETMDKIYSNLMISEKLGVNRDDEGIIRSIDFHNSIMHDDKESKELRKSFYKELFKIYHNKSNSVKNLLLKHKNHLTGEIFYFEHSIEVEERNPDNSITLIGGFMLDVTENIRRNEQITFLANNDVLTKVHNRNYFDKFTNGPKLPKSYLVILFDIDGLKLINDAFGHYQGDRIIKDFAKMLKDIFIDSLCIARIGGDEFVVVSNVTQKDQIDALVEVLEKSIKAYNETSNIKMIVSLGGREVINRDITFEKAFTKAEDLMYRRKLNNRSSRKSQVLESIMETLNAKTEETKEHSERLAFYASKIISELGFFRSSEIEDVLLLARVHDIGKITIPDNILNKDSNLSVEEFSVIKKHSEAGYKIVKNITNSDNVSLGVLSHHERFDGSGYPQGLKGDEIPIYARVLSVVDSFDAMTHDRVYHKAISKEEAIQEIINCSGTQFDPKVVKAFLKSCFDIVI